MTEDTTVNAAQRRQALSEAHRILEMVEALMLTANAATDPESKAHKVGSMRRYLDELNELMEERPFLAKEDRERFEALTLVLKVFAGIDS